MKKKAIVVYSGGMDSSICLAQAIEKYGLDGVLALTFSYGQRHSTELDAAKLICHEWGVDQKILALNCLSEITSNSLVDHNMDIFQEEGSAPNSMVIGRNGLMARIAAIHINNLGGQLIYMGIIGVEAANSGYRDCTRKYMDLMEDIMRIDLDDSEFKIITPIVHMTKCETLELAYSLGVLAFLLGNTITCYRGVPREGCQECPACLLRNEGVAQFKQLHPGIQLPY